MPGGPGRAALRLGPLRTARGGARGRLRGHARDVVLSVALRCLGVFRDGARVRGEAGGHVAPNAGRGLRAPVEPGPGGVGACVDPVTRGPGVAYPPAMPTRLAACFALLLIAACSSDPLPAPAEDAPDPDAAEAAPCGGACGPGTVCELGRCVAVIGPDASPDAASDAAVDAPTQDSPAEASVDAAMESSVPICPAGQVLCGQACSSTERDPDNCGACGTRCGRDPARHLIAACADGRCATTCERAWADCDGTLSNGCEADLSGRNHCGSCLMGCSRSQVCSMRDGGYTCFP